MTQKSLVYVLIAVAVGYLLISAIPQQGALYSTPQPVIRGGETGELMKWWTLDILFALMIYWIAKRRLV